MPETLANGHADDTTGWSRLRLNSGERHRVAAAIAVSLLTYALCGSSLFRTVENRLYDARLCLAAGNRLPPEDIVIIGIDEESLERLEPALGRWPWPRAAMASVLDYCSRARVIALDVLYPERDATLRGSDEAFVDSMRACSNVVNSIYLSTHPLQHETSPLLANFALPVPLAICSGAPRYRSVLRPFPALLAASAALGHVNARLEEDGVARSHAAVACADGSLYPSLALASVALYRSATPHLAEDGTLRVGDTRLRLDTCGTFRVSPSKWSHRYYPIASVIQAWQSEADGKPSRLTRDVFRDKIVLIGSTAAGLMDDTHVTPLSLHTRGIEWSASAIENMLSGRSARSLAGFTFALILLCSLVPTTRRQSNPLLLVGICTGFSVLYLVIDIVAVFNLQWFLPIAGPISALLLSGAACTALAWHEEAGKRRELEDLENSRDRLTSMLVHDLRNSLVPVVAGLDFMQTEAGQAIEGQFLPSIRDSSNQLLCQVNSLLDIRRMQSNRLRLRREDVVIDELLERVWRQYQLTAGRRNTTLCLMDRDGPPLVVNGDAAILERLMANLVWNAIKYARNDTVIHVGTDGEADDKVRLLVRNHCKVIPPNLHQSLFEAFTTGERPAGSPVFHSVGLGLAFCKMAAEAHGGSIHLESPCPAYGEEDGVEVNVILPFNQQG